MPTEQPFDMPASGTFEQRGGWVVRRLMVDAALSLPQAAGFVGNPAYESAGFTKLQEIKPLVPGSRGGTGWCQWTAARRVNFERWCAEKNWSPGSDRANYGFMLYELLGDYKGFTGRLRQMPTIEDACHWTHQQYERPQDAIDGSYRSGPDRLKWARRALNGALALMGPNEGLEPPPVISDNHERKPAASNPSANPAPIAIVPQVAPASNNPIELIRQAQRLLGVEEDGDCGPVTRAKASAYRAAHPNA